MASSYQINYQVGVASNHRLQNQIRIASLWLVNLIRDFPRRIGRLSGTFKAFPEAPRITLFVPWLHAVACFSFDLLGGPEVVQFCLHLITLTRPLRMHEIKIAEEVFGQGTLRLADVRVAYGGLLDRVFKMNRRRAFTTWHTINIPIERQSDLTLVIHELTHVYQYERVGTIYIGQGLWAQRKMGQRAYDYGGEEGLVKDLAIGRRYCDYNREQQGQIAQDYCRLRLLGRDTTPYEPLIQELKIGKF